MTKIFYDHLVAIEELTTELDRLNNEEGSHITALIDETLHHHVLDTILTHLPKEHHETFLAHFHKAPADPQLLLFIKERITIDIEQAIQKKAATVKKDIRSAMEKSKWKSP